MLSEEYVNKFGGVGRLYGQKELERLASSHVCVVGLGGVGSWVVESLARSGIGKLTLVDFDDICLSNFNRQIHSIDGKVGQLKTSALAERVNLICSQTQVNIIDDSFSKENCKEILATNYDYVVDAIDGISAKCILLNECVEKKIKVITVGAAGGRKDPLKIKLDDLSRSRDDQIFKYVRKKLRREYGFSRDPEKKFRIPCVYSTERPVYAQEDGTACYEKPLNLLKPLDCSSGVGTAVFVTGAFGFVAASKVLNDILSAH